MPLVQIVPTKISAHLSKPCGSRDTQITSLDAAATFEELCWEVRDMCSFYLG